MVKLSCAQSLVKQRLCLHHAQTRVTDIYLSLALSVRFRCSVSMRCRRQGLSSCGRSYTFGTGIQAYSCVHTCTLPCIYSAGHTKGVESSILIVTHTHTHTHTPSMTYTQARETHLTVAKGEGQTIRSLMQIAIENLSSHATI